MTIFATQISKLNSVIEFDVESLPAVSISYLIGYGLKQCLNDTHAALKRADYEEGDLGDAHFRADVEVVVGNREWQIRNGCPPAERAPVDQEARALGRSLKDAGVTPKELAEWLAQRAEAGMAA